MEHVSAIYIDTKQNLIINNSRYIMKCCICKDYYVYPLAFRCNRHMACAGCIVGMFASGVSYNADTSRLECEAIRCPVCRAYCGRLSTYVYTCGLGRLSGIKPVPDDLYHLYNLYTDTKPVSTCLFCPYTGSVNEVCNHIISSCHNIAVPCPLCHEHIPLRDLINREHTLVCPKQVCRYCYRIVDHTKIRRHENVHSHYRKLQTQMYMAANEIDKVPVCDDVSNTAQIEKTTNLLMHIRRAIYSIKHHLPQ